MTLTSSCLVLVGCVVCFYSILSCIVLCCVVLYFRNWILTVTKLLNDYCCVECCMVFVAT